MRITNLTQSKPNANQVLVYIDSSYFLSLTLDQVLNFKIKVGMLVDEPMLAQYKQASHEAKFFFLALDYCHRRPRFVSEIQSYLIGKKCSPREINSIICNLQDKNMLNDEQSAGHWIEYRRQKKGISSRRLKLELLSKGVSEELIDNLLEQSSRSDVTEIVKIVEKKYHKYDRQRLIKYLLSHGFSYDLITQALEDYATEQKSS